MQSEDGDDIEQQLKQAEQELNEPERELYQAMLRFIDGKVAEGSSRKEAITLVREMLRKARDAKARERRASFRVI